MTLHPGLVIVGGGLGAAAITADAVATTAQGNNLTGIILGGIFGLAIPVSGIIIAMVNKRTGRSSTDPAPTPVTEDTLEVHTRLRIVEENMADVRDQVQTISGADLRRELNDIHETLGRLEGRPVRVRQAPRRKAPGEQRK